MIETPPPSAEAQLAFLTKLQRLFAEGDFTATYKFALLIALSDLAVETGVDDGSSLVLTNRQIAERFVQIYWRHAMPYGTGGSDSSGVLVQNMGAQAAVLNLIAAFRASTAVPSPQQAIALPAYCSLIAKVAATVSAQPLTYLQNFGGLTDPFLYDREERGRIRLKAGVSYCLRRFYPLVQRLSRTHWVEHVKSNRRNHAILGDAGDLEDFLFSISRQSLALIGRELRKLDGAHCFYCAQRVEEADVDHFIPFVVYPRDLAHTFVLAHPLCNRSKSDSLAGMPHLERWLDRLSKHSDALAEIAAKAGVTADAQTIKRVAAWGYTNAYRSGARAWLAPAKYEAIDGGHCSLFTP